MASFLQKSTPWIEDAFVAASSFDHVAAAVAASNNDHDDGDRGGCEHYQDGIDDDDTWFDSQAEPEPQTESTIPSGLLPSPDEGANDGGFGRRGRIVQVIQRGGDFHHYFRDGDGNSAATCPPYLILHDGQHSAVAFLSPEAVAGLIHVHDNLNVPPNKSLVSVSDYTISTILQCASTSLRLHSQVIADLYRNTLLIPPNLRPQLHALVNPQQFMSLYLRRPIALIGAENQGLIGEPVDVHCSPRLRRMLAYHERRHPGEGSMEEEGYSHLMLIRKLEAWHSHCQYLAGPGPWEMSDWPWETELADAADGDANMVPGNVNCLIKPEEDLEDLLGSDLEVGGGAAEEDEEGGGGYPGRVDLGDEFEDEATMCGADERRGQVVVAAGGGSDDDDKEGREATPVSGERNDRRGTDDAADGGRAGRETVGIKNDDAVTDGANDPGVSDGDATVPMEDDGNRQKRAASGEGGNEGQPFGNSKEVDDFDGQRINNEREAEGVIAAKPCDEASNRGTISRGTAGRNGAIASDDATGAGRKNDATGAGRKNDASVAPEGDVGHREQTASDEKVNCVDALVEQGNVAELFEKFEDLEDILNLPPSSSEDESCRLETEDNTVGPSPEGSATRSASSEADLLQECDNAAGAERRNELERGTSQRSPWHGAASFVGINDMIIDEDEEEDKEEEVEILHKDDENHHDESNAFEPLEPPSTQPDYIEEEEQGSEKGDEVCFDGSNDHDAEPDELLATQPESSPTMHAACDEDSVEEEEEGDGSQILLSPVEETTRTTSAEEPGRLREPGVPSPARDERRTRRGRPKRKDYRRDREPREEDYPISPSMRKRPPEEMARRSNDYVHVENGEATKMSQEKSKRKRVKVNATKKALKELERERELESEQQVSIDEAPQKNSKDSEVEFASESQITLTKTKDGSVFETRSDQRGRVQREEELGACTESQIPLSTENATREARGSAEQHDEEDYVTCELESQIPLTATWCATTKVPRAVVYEREEAASERRRSRNSDKQDYWLESLIHPKSTRVSSKKALSYDSSLAGYEAYGPRRKKKSKSAGRGGKEKRRVDYETLFDKRAFANSPSGLSRKRPINGPKNDDGPLGDGLPGNRFPLNDTWRPAFLGQELHNDCNDSDSSDGWMLVVSSKRARKRAKSSALRQSDKAACHGDSYTHLSGTRSQPENQQSHRSPKKIKKSSTTKSHRQEQVSHNNGDGCVGTELMQGRNCWRRKRQRNQPAKRGIEGDHRVRFAMGNSFTSVTPRGPAMLDSIPAQRSEEGDYDKGAHAGSNTKPNADKGIEATPVEIGMTRMLERASRLLYK